MKIAIATASLKLELRRSLDAAAKTGAHGVTLDLRYELNQKDFGDTAIRQLKHYLGERDLSLAAGTFPLRTTLTEKEYLDLRIAGIKSAMDFAAKLNIRQLIMRWGRIPKVDEAIDPTFQTIAREICQHGNLVGVTPCLAPSGDSPNTLRQLIQAIDTGPIAVEADLGGWVMQRQNPLEQLRELYNLIAHVQIRDAISDVDGSGREVPVGRGEIDWDHVAALLHEMEYRQWMTVARNSGENRFTEMSNAVAYIKRVFMIDQLGAGS